MNYVIGILCIVLNAPMIETLEKLISHLHSLKLLFLSAEEFFHTKCKFLSIISYDFANIVI